MKKKLIIFSLIFILIVSGLFVLTGCGNSGKFGNSEKASDGSQENRYFILKDHKGYYNEEGDKYIVEGTIVNKTDQTFENKVIMIRVFFADGTYSYFASCTIEKLEPYGEVKIVADTPYLDHNSQEIVSYELK